VQCQNTVAAPPRRRWPSSRSLHAGGKPQPNAGPSGPAFVRIRCSRHQRALRLDVDSAPRSPTIPEKTITLNRRARHEYSIEDSLEAGIVLSGTEIKSIRAGKINLADAYARIEKGEAWLVGAHIAPWEGGNRLNHEPKRDRKLLLHRDQIDQLLGKTKAKGLTLIPLKIYITERGKAKLELGLGKGKQLYDRRREIAARDSRREVERELAESGRR
jgi:SsrA-binding protein